MDFVFNPDGKKVIVSIDGGGMRGVLALMMLVYLEEQLGKPAYEFIDMVSGTSTGAIIGAGLGLGISAKDILEIAYRERLPKAFGKTSGFSFWWQWIVKHRFRYQFSLEPFRKALLEFGENKRVRDMDKCIVLMTVKDMRSSNTYFVVNEGPGADMFGDWPVLGAVAASGAAPIYFPPVLGNLVDGGTGQYGNPCLAAAIEAVEYIGFDPANTLHLSLGTGYVSNFQADGASAKFNPLKWLRYIAIEGVDDAAIQQVYSTRSIYSQQRGMDFRRYNVDLEQDIVENVLGVDTRGLTARKLGLDSSEPEQIALMERIGRAYAERIDWSAPNLMPWDTVGGRKEPGIIETNWLNSVYAIT